MLLPSAQHTVINVTKHEWR